jgi:hypothetical protein
MRFIVKLGERLRRPSSGALVYLLPAVVPLVLFGVALVQGLLIAPGDGGSYYLPLYMLAARAWEAGGLPAWNPYSFSGAPLLALGQAGVFYPPNLLMVVLPTFVGYDLLLIFHVFMAGLGASLLALRLCRDPFGAAAAGVGFALSGFWLGHLAHTSLEASAAWLPWTLLGFELLRERVSAPRLLLAGSALALGVLAGHFQMVAITLMALGVYALALAAIGRSGRGRSLLLAGVTAGLGLCLGAVQLLPTASVLDQTARATYSYDQAMTYSFNWSHLALLFFPYLFGNPAGHLPFTAPYGGEWNLTELAGYPGLALLVLAAAGLGVVRRDPRAAALAATGGLALIAALGASTPVGRLIYALPVYGHFRDWARYVVIVDLVVALLAACGVAALRDRSAGVRRAAGLRGCAMAAAVVLAALVLPRLGPIADRAAPGYTGVLAVAFPTVSAVLAGGCCLLAWRRPGPAVVAVLLLLVCVDPVLSFGGFFEWRSPTPFAKAQRLYSPSEPPKWGWPPNAPGGIDRYLSLKRGSDIDDVRQIRSATGNDSLAPREYMEATGMTEGRIENLEAVRPPSHVLDLLRVSVVVGARSDSFAPDGDRGRHDHRPGLPEAFVVGAAREMPRAAVLDHLHGRRPFDPGRLALIESPCNRWCPRLDSPGSVGRVTRSRWGSGAVGVEVEARRPGLLVISQAWFPGWQGEVDGKPSPVVRTDGLVTGVPVAAGRHRVELRYRPPGFRAGMFISLAVLIALIAAALGGWLASPTRRRFRISPNRRTGGDRVGDKQDPQLFDERHGRDRRLTP